MSSGRRDIIFFGSIAVSIIGHEVHDEAVAAQLERQNARIKLHTTARAPYAKTEEVFGLDATSPLYEIDSADFKASPASSLTPQRGASHPRHHRQKAAFLPVMLKLAQDAAVGEVPSVEDQDGALLQLDSPTNSADPAPSYASASVRIEVGMSRSGGDATPVGTKDVFLPSLNYLAIRDMCTVVRIPVWSNRIQKSETGEVDVAELDHRSPQPQRAGDGNSRSSGGVLGGVRDRNSRGDAVSGVALSVYAMVRVISLAEKVRLALEADDAVRCLLSLPDPVPRMSLALTQRGDAPYGAMPLTELYEHHRQFFGYYSNTIIKHSSVVTQRLAEAPRQREADASFPHRWNTLTVVDLRPALLGEDAFAPLLVTLAYCANLRALYADGNHLGDLTCARLSALFRRHRYLARVSLSKNTIHEAGGEQLLRLVRNNLRITSMPCQGNYFSDALRSRIEEVARRNASVIAQDPLNIFSASYDYLTGLSSLPNSLQQQGLRTWAMLSAAPVGDVDVMVRNFTTSTQRTLGDSPVVAMQRAKAALRARESFSLIPPAALAPLLNEIMRTVSVGVSRVLPDPLVRSLFSDMETVVALEQEQVEAQRRDELAGGSRDALLLPPDVCDAVGGVYTPPVDSETMYARSFVRIVVAALRGVALGTPWAEIAKVLEGIGRVHRDLGVMPEDYWLAVHIFMTSLRISCGAECYDADNASSFLGLLALAVRTAAGTDTVLQ
ncbi:hypothetical protein conserved [Leishmania donovani]|uniref:Hypothetical_protein_conserved n=1 Tax=Leishmania donovani TaxID=5661 RepID=A0A3Q8IB10_LEIDO|nr:hypothetical protein, conserved [Leishmania donovani]AYU78486.1 hypothetical protein LdCL_210007300 [Leishmania donovani]TPP49258.1 hypothetical protein CGC21_33830 [Leishmania donovani]TPP54758.1 hypothetical protein CGC20_22755 [Leishmania donovani]CAJ1988493.1 hypothetical protein conserved [Leishmania donovani]CBZ33836.1 hypothetical protein, conserved [Leishmania donovani]